MYCDVTSRTEKYSSIYRSVTDIVQFNLLARCMMYDIGLLCISNITRANTS